MKVCTDACLFGAWISAHRLPLTAHRLLDIGTGTGLLSLMFAQKNANAIIDTVEIDEAAAQQAIENFEASPWQERLKVYNSPIQQFANASIRKYDIIISNPPFYESDLKSGDSKRNLALHSAALKLEELVSITENLLNDEGSFFVLLPYYRAKDLETLVAGKFFVKEKMLIKQTPKHIFFRTVFWLSKQAGITAQSEITIMNEAGKYTSEFIALLKDYYLNL